ncbi:hypothetical protein MIMGU_mgv1a026204mg [Erythranthe guttata]|uniref:Cytochrome P450 n=1 Tax=Erythranthe guttata TaxID=4155 RepID=A0A022Q7E9_ERYGU|nr:hypothetical protein MIMGU_mgv1a026204mg [Erythranthe guttata]
MEEVQILQFTYPVLVISLFLLCRNEKNLPPSPQKLPIIGNLHQMGILPHRNLQILAQKQGPLMLLNLGSVPVLIASSADAARAIMRTHDINFANRPPIKAFKKLIYDGKSISLAPYGEYWRQAKSIFVLHLLSGKRVQSFRSIREEETALFVKRIAEYSSSDGKTRVVNLSKMFSEFSNDGICRSAFGRKYSVSENGEKALMLLSEFLELLGTVNIGDFIPWLGWITRVNGLDKRLNRVAKEMDDFLEDVIQQHMASITPKGKTGENFVDILLEICNSNTADVSSFDRDSIKALLLDVFAGGTDTVSTVLEWLMAELLRHLREIVGSKHGITDEDLEKMDYMKAVIKETLRRHPPSPFISTPDSYNKGLDFELIPFGSGRRGCPGISFAVATIELVLANIVHKFNWELPDGVQGQDLDMSEHPGGIVHRAIPLLAVATDHK